MHCEFIMSKFLIIGLGNPGRDYAHNRHNVGFMAVTGLPKRTTPPSPGGRTRPSLLRFASAKRPLSWPSRKRS